MPGLASAGPGILCFWAKLCNSYAMPRDAPKTRYPFPPDRFGHFPDSTPWDTPISELSPWWLRVQCICDAGTVLYPLRLMAAEIGWERTLRTIVPKLRCRKCGGRPESVAIVERADGDDHTTREGREHVLVERG